MNSPKRPARKAGLFGQVPVWIMIGAMAVLSASVAALYARSASREKAVMSQILFEKGTALIRSFEAGARTGMGMRWSSAQLQTLLEETARQPDIVYLAVTDENGLVLAHNNKTMIGKILDVSHLRSQAGMSGGGQGNSAPDGQRWSWRLTTSAFAGDSGEAARGAFEVYGHFQLPRFPYCGADDCDTDPDYCPAAESGQSREQIQEPGKVQDQVPRPGRGGGAGLGRGLGRGRGLGMGPGGPPGNVPVGAARFIFAGFDVAPFERARQADLRATAVVSGAVLMVSLGLVLSLFMAGRARAARAALRDMRAFSAEIVASLPVGLITTGPDGIIAQANAAALDLVGLPAQSVIGATPDAIFPPGWCGLKERLARGENVLEIETECSFAGNAPVPVSISAARITGEDGSTVGEVFILRDLREVKTLREEVRRREKLSALGSLAAGVAHEIRNPLSSVKGFATYLGGKFAVGSEEKRAATVMIGEVDRLNRVITQLLEFARPGDLSPRQADPVKLAESALRLVEREAKAKGVRLAFENRAGEIAAELDPDRLTQALLNLVLNAVEATDEGGEVRVVVDQSAQGAVAITVSDTGRGIEAADLTQVFNPYFTTKAAGTGLGLAIVHKIVEGHGGSVSVVSEPGRGASFTVTLPPGGVAVPGKEVL